MESYVWFVYIQLLYSMAGRRISQELCLQLEQNPGAEFTQCTVSVDNLQLHKVAAWEHMRQ